MAALSKLIQADTTFDLLLGSLELFPECQDYANHIVFATLGRGNLFDKDGLKTLADFKAVAKPELAFIVSVLIGESMVLKKSDVVSLKAASAKLKSSGVLPNTQLYLNNIVFFVERYNKVKFHCRGILHQDFIGFNCYTLSQLY